LHKQEKFLQALTPTLPAQFKHAKKEKTKITIKSNKILSQFGKTKSIVNNLVPDNGVKSLID